MKKRILVLVLLIVVFFIVYACDGVTLSPRPRWNPEDPNYDAETDPANSDEAAPVEPSNFTATALSSSSIKLSWEDNSAYETGYELNRKIGETGEWADVQAGLAADSVEYTDAGLTATTLYYYELAAINDNGVSPVKIASATTLAEGVGTANWDEVNWDEFNWE